MDSNIGSIAKEVAESMDVEKMFGSMDKNANPMEVMAQMMQPDKMGSIFQNISKFQARNTKFLRFWKSSLLSAFTFLQIAYSLGLDIEYVVC